MLRRKLIAHRLPEWFGESDDQAGAYAPYLPPPIEDDSLPHFVDGHPDICTDSNGTFQFSTSLGVGTFPMAPTND